MSSGNNSSYKLLVSNNDRSSSDSTALIKNLTVEPYRNYWLLVDGSEGATGNVMVDLLSNSLEVYPNPSTGKLNIIISNNDDGPADVKIVSLTGQILYANVIPVTKENNTFNFDLSPFSSGLYFLVVTINKTTLTAKLLLQK